LLNLDPEILLNSKPYSSCKSTSLHWNWWGNRVSRQWGNLVSNSPSVLHRMVFN